MLLIFEGTLDELTTVLITKNKYVAQLIIREMNEVSCPGLMRVWFDNFQYANMSVQYTAIFHCCKNDDIQMKIFDIFLIFAQNIDCGYTLEPPH